MDKKIQQKIRYALKEIWLRSDLRRNAVKRATKSLKVGEFKNGKDKNLNHVVCEKCQKVSPEKEKDYQVDHISPVVDPKVGFLGWDQYINRLLNCGADNIQVLCKRCHAIKTKREKA